MSRTTRPLLGAALVSLGVLLAPAAASAQSIEAQVDSVSARLNAARSDHLHLIAPRHFQRAIERLSEARQRLEAGGSINAIRERLAEARQELSRAEELREVGAVLLKRAIAAREEALRANATEFAPEAYQRASAELLRAGREVEDGDQNDARDRAEEARRRFREAQLLAIERNLLGRARELRERARERDARDRSPRLYARADSLLRSAESLLRQDPSSQSRAASLAESAAAEFRHATRISAQADTFDRDGGIEDLVLRAESQIRRVASALDFEPEFADGLEPATDDVLAAVRSMQDERAGLQERVRTLRAEVDTGQARLDSLRQRLARLGESQEQVAAELRERRRREARLRDVRTLFSSEEAEVLTRGDELVLRLIGLQFASGSADIRPEHFSLLTKVRSVIREFPDAPVTIQGHTDSRGNDELNQSLSVRRAIAVREYLLANTTMSADRIDAEGYGESQPIASNDTQEGRSMNRRIDIVLDISGP